MTDSHSSSASDTASHAETGTSRELHAADRLLKAIDRFGSPICVGLDPVLERLPATIRDGAVEPAAAIERFSMGVIDALVGVAPCVKFQSACYERLGAPGVAALTRCLAHACAARMQVILDAKRGDIGVTATHYAEAAFGAGTVDWITVNPYLGADGLDPFYADAARGATVGAFALVRTSNPSGDALQTLRLAEGGTVCDAVAGLVDRLGCRSIGAMGYSNLGAVVGATKPDDAARLRAAMPHAIFLVPGIGAQGADMNDVRHCFHDDGRGAIVTSSRAVIYAFDDDARWTEQVRAAAQRFADEVRTAIGL